MHVARVEPLPVPGGSLDLAHGRIRVLPEASTIPETCDAAFAILGKALVAYEPMPVDDGARVLIPIDAAVRGNAFRPLHEGPRSFAALLSLAASRRLHSGPESERAIVVLRGNGLVFLENADTLRFAPLAAILLPAGEAASLWAQGPEDVLAVVLQPRASAPAPKRTLKSEIAKARASTAAQESPGGTGSS